MKACAYIGQLCGRNALLTVDCNNSKLDGAEFTDESDGHYAGVQDRGEDYDEKPRSADERVGCIVNVASLLGLKGGKGSAAYAASKAGVIGFTRALAAELGEKNVRVNVIVPGYVETDMTNAMTPEAHSAALNAIPLKRFGHPSEIADAAMFLATNKYASNCVLNLDGGLSAT
ncbi:3-oxoacyl-[acyl-carrier-protein] reductase FabG [Lachnellula suecica]|uniref:3-oxoacyl-[acyl-carrier-protein] reductase FabG n=1 Tax=Lachnellula suecica TaxID=602035 RepID=A0A8T9C299_9HELO|nr:3-oxoacyl-[acyl-carrier-protein] reductase FabG [Lachnellula suecica]